MQKMASIRAFLAFLGLALTLTGASSDYVINHLENPEESLREASSQPTLKKKLKKSSKVTGDTLYSKKLAALGINLRPGTEHRSDSKSTVQTSRRCRSLVYQTLAKLPAAHRKELKELTLFYTKDGRRGLGGSGSIVLRCLNVTDAELVSVLVHEIGHLVDGGHLGGSYTDGVENFSGFYDFDDPVAANDPSAYFYSIAWTNESVQKAEVSEIDFVSMYAMSDPFEDFAETYTYFRLHGGEFRKLMQSSVELQKKYEFMKHYVFYGQEFGDANEDREDIDIWERGYDATIVPFPLRSFLS